MSKIGRKPIPISKVEVNIQGQEVHYKGPKASGVYILPAGLAPRIEDGSLLLQPEKTMRDANRLWGLHRALLFNAIHGAGEGFKKEVKITGLGYKAAVSGDKVVFSLGYSHKIDFVLPEGVTLAIDKTGQNLTFESYDKARLGDVCGSVRALRPPEPYKGTGIRLASETIIRKAGKTKS